MIGLRLTSSTAVWSSILAMTSYILLNNLPKDNNVLSRSLAVLGVVSAISALLTLLTFKGATLRQWIVRRWRSSHTKLNASMLVNAKNRAMVWDGKSANMLIEMFGEQWTLSKVTSTGETTAQQIPLDELRDVLRQFDITANHIRVIQYGYKAGAEDRASSAVLSNMGVIPYLLGGRTFIELSISHKNNVNAVYSRQRDGDTVADGMNRVVSIATDRVLRVLQSNNIRAKVVTPAAALGIHKDIAGALKEAAARPRWDMLGSPGDAEIGSVVSFTPTEWSVKAQQHWNEVMAHRQYTCLSLRPNGKTDTISYAVSYLTNDPETLHLLPSQGLRRENGRQLSRVTNLLPLIHDTFVDDDGGRVLYEESDVDLMMPVQPLGVYLGMNKSRERVFMNISRGSTPLWIVDDEEYARRLVFRLSTQRHRIAVAIPGQDWVDLVQARRSRLLTHTDTPLSAMTTSDILVCTPEFVSELEPSIDGPSVIVVSQNTPPIAQSAIITQDEDNEGYIKVVSNNSVERIRRERPPTERNWIVED